ncbi:MAG: bifunctional proline dehydrogenase/L-glutamate gamma-semialdehyde dehydrogenase PutA [Azospirillaceae bacterium]|nr:bifunctional proline dehydrogenase/L-glutamate gamma-semialdehyde dehydrogenase PutA [Azospirillaceae bacterium]
MTVLLPPPSLTPRAAMAANNLADEAVCLDALVAIATLPAERQARAQQQAARLVEGVRSSRTRFGLLDAFLQEYGLSTKEGVALMCLAEALLRIPDAATADSLIRDKIGSADWDRHLGQGETLFVNASTWALMLTGRVVRLDEAEQPSSLMGRLIARSGAPLIRQATVQAMKILGRQFVMGRSIAEGLARARDSEKHGYRYSYDMLGEAARTAADGERYQELYGMAIDAIGAARGSRDVVSGPGISIKLSALYPRYEVAQRERVMAVLLPRFKALALRAKQAGIGMTVDAEEADRLELSLDLFEAVCVDPALDGWDGFGIAIQAYQKRAIHVVDWVVDLARRQRRRMMIRLVKGAYWDSEIKRAQERGLPGYPVFTRKASTDVSYLACARRLLAARDVIFPMFATHNAQTVATVIEMSAVEMAAPGRFGRGEGFEFQRLHGMGEPLYDQIVKGDGGTPGCRVYAPVGSHEDLLAYLVRRLLENGANSSFVNRIQDEKVPVAEIVADPVVSTAALAVKSHPRIPLPRQLYPDRLNSQGLDLSDPGVTGPLLEQIAAFDPAATQAAPIIDGVVLSGPDRPVENPADITRIVGSVVEASAEQVGQAVAAAVRSFRAWTAVPPLARAAILERAADLIEAERAALMALLVREAGKCIPDALAEVREAADFCRYYALRTRTDFAQPLRLVGPTGETNDLLLEGRGVFACISPWNFPLAIFVGQIAAALAAGNSVVAKPAEQTPLIAAFAVRLLHRAGIPPGVLHLLPGDGESVGAPLVADRRLAGVAFTGSTATARAINRVLAAREGAIIPLIAETGGQNVMIVDSTALPEQVVDDVLTSAFRSAGQRCSALRVLFLPDGTADTVIRMLRGATAELRLGDPGLLATDIGPVIDRSAHAALLAHVAQLRQQAKPLFDPPPADAAAARGWFVAPQAFEITRLDQLDHEVFGPILHIIRYGSHHLDAVLDSIAATGYGLTLGIHTRIDATVRQIVPRVPVGNVYVNRNMIGAVVGVQPFGGQGLSGTGPKAGGPRTLLRYATERTITINTTAAGGNAALVSMDET